MSYSWLKIIGGLVLLASWVFREMWARRQEQKLSTYARELDGKARAEDSLIVIRTQNAILNSMTIAQTTLGFPDDEIGQTMSPMTVDYLARVGKFQVLLEKSKKDYAIQRLSHIWAIVKGTEADSNDKSKWSQLPLGEIINIGDDLVPHINLVGKRLGRNTKWADRIVAAMYIIGATLVLFVS